MPDTVDAVVIGAGPNGLVAAATLADAGWDVLVLEAQSEPGGAVRSAELFPGYCSDLFSAFYPLAVASPVLRRLDLESHGLRWSRAPVVLGHPHGPDDDDAVLLHPDPEHTARELRRRDPRDGDAWLRTVERWRTLREPLLAALLDPFPPIKAGLRLARATGRSEMLDLVRFLMLPAGRMAQELFASEAARLLILGNAMHADAPLDAGGSGVMGYLLTMLAQDGGYPVPVGGAGALTAALVSRAEAAGAQVRCATQVAAIETRSGVATGVRTAGGELISARRAVIADVSAPALYDTLLRDEDVPSAIRSKLHTFEWDTPTVKVNYALSRAIPWRSAGLTGAGTVHLGADEHGLLRWNTDLNTGVLPESPFMLFGQMTTADPSRSPAGTESAWAYTHLPRGIHDDDHADELAARVDRVLEAHAPGFLDTIVGRSVQRPSDLEAANANLHGGAVNGGTSQLHQQLVFRPLPGLAGPETPVAKLYLGSSAAHPGGGVHGACGFAAAHAALGGGARRRTRRALMRWVAGG
ncbi:NAD(P)/FAD-dependent oxidoreductase [Aldersonia sp. NBC_00410]|uniref:phytoene desaturase family protein n=1 Tax=Aldersonia sp. NBC_00410 TaxID=2975954 RepID=UPI0022516EAA|nr:NAD(P)/FAD-dependent oxidoreductase [Aldersonia sp. NBC_00410]MCX5043877.1 NAD(P)/FAD-dependent oxidoreductase [Aldersonia sp. NBC_00410]